MSSSKERHQVSRLLTLYILASLVPLSIIGAVLVRGYQDAGLELGRDQGRAQAAVIAEMVIAPALRGADLPLGLSLTERRRLEAATDLAIFNGTVEHLRLRSYTGSVKFSDDGSVGGAVSVDDPAFRAAAAGKTDVRIIEATTRSIATVRVLQPVIARASGQATGVLEVYLPYQPIALKVQGETHDQISRLAVSLVGLFAVLALISWWTTRALRENAASHEYQSLHDSLTGLPNRELFRRKAEDALARGRRGEAGALVLIDLDHFKEVNDTLGHHAGDELLRIVARRLRESLRTDDTVARLGGDEFAMVLPRGGDRAETFALLTRIRHELSEEVILDGVALNVEASFGVSFYPENVATVEDLLQHADAAMYQGKHGPDGVVFYEPSIPHHPSHALVVQRELRLALEREELTVYYQPKIELSTGRATGVEALVRWQHPERGLLQPSEFLPAAESSQLIGPLTTWVLRRALADYTMWTAAGHDWTVAVNLSARNLASMEFVDSVRQMLGEAGVRPDRVHLEVTETALAFDAELAGRVVGALSAQGISMAVDDFGVGYTSLSQLRMVGISEIKIDRTFVTGLLANEQDCAIARSVIDLGHSLGCLVTAEGVESQEVADWLVDAGCDHAQGYLWLRPSPWTDVARAFGATSTKTTNANASGPTAPKSVLA
jgi:diguanylate cyclase (GGDEF)-like protein